MRLDSFNDVLQTLRHQLLDGVMLDRGEWQGQTDKPMTRVLETYNVTFQVPVPKTTTGWQKEVGPNLPWAEDHFQERVSGEPLNPGEEYKNWPWYEQGVEDHKVSGQFSHTYMERFWPQYAGRDQDSGLVSKNQGTRFMYGDLATLIENLRDRPMTRQAYLPIWFPEDLVASYEGERVPCTLGYHFQRRPHPDIDSLDITYFMRSCDWFRYLRDDVYLAGRLLQWVVKELDRRSMSITPVETGHLSMHIVNLHCFADERQRLEKEWKVETQRRLSSAF